ncbi:NAD(P)H-binding protein [Acinetobacter sp. B5B]|uniref:NAD(P)H-binding protein n=1 Tax=Acinetobacter baretiae TaxID=2605383 RepID=UPI0018C2EA1A|nr:NAD(P)H-binding protein [Acinetobacter baretiae]MBF7681793.1 NAD(P)H-binding protein [Acinetobacter baretiae]MBF7685405.1 NAD(P)H-binding protein [Acinetobacter baretiae]
MSHVFIIGGSGQIAKKTIQRLRQKNISVSAMYRHTTQKADLEALGAEPVFADLTQLSQQELNEILRVSQAHTVIFTAGAGGKGGQEATNLVDGQGLEMTVTAGEHVGIQRLILVSAFPEAGRTKNLGDNFENYMNVKKKTEYFLTKTKLNWIILRPGTLVDDEGTGQIEAGVALPYGTISRDDVAQTLVSIIEEPLLNRKIIEVVQGSQDIQNAISALLES